MLEQLLRIQVPRSAKPIVRAAALEVLPWFYAGSRVACPCCESTFRSFMGHEGQADARCPRCLALKRHRLLWLFICDHANGVFGRQRILHFGPEYALYRNLRSAPGVEYVTADLTRAWLVDIAADITDIPFRSDYFDLVLCNHVLEHVPDDQRALAELFRVLKPGGRALMMHPVDMSRSETYEDPSIVSKQDREEAFGQHDHVRIYGRDLGERIRAAGFEVRADHYANRLSDHSRSRFAVVDEPIFVCVKRPSNAGARSRP